MEHGAWSIEYGATALATGIEMEIEISLKIAARG
jgi:hypothetical protein